MYFILKYSQQFYGVEIFIPNFTANVYERKTEWLIKCAYSHGTRTRRSTCSFCLNSEKTHRYDESNYGFEFLYSQYSLNIQITPIVAL